MFKYIYCSRLFSSCACFFRSSIKNFIYFFYNIVKDKYIKSKIKQIFFLEQCFNFSIEFVTYCISKVKINFFEQIFKEFDFSDSDSNIIKVIKKNVLNTAIENMRVKYHINRLETILKRKYPEMNPEIYCSRRKKLVHLALDKSIYQYQNYVGNLIFLL